MPRYFFNLYNDVVTMDEEGVDLASTDAARDEAIRNIRDLMKDDLVKGRIALAHWIEIADGHGQVLGTVRFGEAVTVEG